MVSIDPLALLVQIVNFLVLIWALNAVLYRPIRHILAERKNKFAGLEQGILESERGVAQKEEALKSGMKEAREKGMKELTAYEEKAREEEMKLIEQINEKARADLSDIRRKIAVEAKDAREALNKEIDRFADEISQKILGRAV